MQLKTIKLSGFKSFVDPTSIHFPSQLIGVVGPNGCGKSNIIDAVRWVMGESSAKNLRGGQLTDVIFNGTSERQPVSLATVELTFDNSDKRLGAQYANCSEVSIKREVNRDGQSNYYLNNIRCRRRDISELFSGTGLGPRSYSIIEQNTVSNLIEAKPEVLRTYIEEAAGLSQYKEHRKETENRIERTRANLERLSDLRDELGERLSVLDSQAKSATKYKNLKQTERSTLAKLNALNWQNLHNRQTKKQDLIEQSDLNHENIFAEIQAIDAKINGYQIELTEANEAYNLTQADYYSMGSEIAHIEQQLKFHKQAIENCHRQVEQYTDSKKTAEKNIESTQGQIDAIKSDQAKAEPEAKQVTQLLETAQQEEEKHQTAYQTWQTTWDSFNESYNKASSEVRVKQSKLDSLQQQERHNQHKLESLQSKLSAIELVDDTEAETLEAAIKTLEADESKHQSSVEALESELQEARDHNNHKRQTLAKEQELLSIAKGKQASLLALQEQTTQQSAKQTEWLKDNNLNHLQQLYQSLETDTGYEKAVETILSDQLNALCFDGDSEDEFKQLIENINDLKDGQLMFISRSKNSSSQNSSADKLLNKVRSPYDLSAFLEHVYVTDNLESALKLRSTLKPEESVVTKDGLWLGAHWLKYFANKTENSGVLERDKLLKVLEQEICKLEANVQTISENIEQNQVAIREKDQQKQRHQQQLAEIRRSLQSKTQSLASVQTKIRLAAEQTKQLEQSIKELQEDIQSLQEESETLHQTLCNEREALIELEQEKTGKQTERQQLQQNIGQHRSIVQQHQNTLHKITLQTQQLASELQNKEERLTYHKELIESSLKNIEQQQTEKNSHTKTSEELAQIQQDKLKQKLGIEESLKEKQLGLEAIQHHIKEQQNKRAEKEIELEKTRTELESLKIESQTLKVKSEALLEQLQKSDLSIEDALNSCEPSDSVTSLERLLNQTRNTIANLGSINLMAIEEFEKQSERKNYLDSQNDDLVQALETLMAAIHKIDAESRKRFKETFDTINEGLQRLFPKVFEGGKAYMELTSHDPLDAGVTIMARPPGKKNSSIQMLSGGEKALTALSLVFSIFQLNPAPFCLLDEVDAPLDDVNVGRFCALIKEMSKDVQFIIVTHNKISMEMMTHLAGVTMREPGVSRLVAVDIERAMALVDA